MAPSSSPSRPSNRGQVGDAFGAAAAVAPIDDGVRARADDRYLALAERIAFWMDRRYIDPILGFLLPGAGNAIGAGIGLLGIYAAFRLRAHPIVIARMLIHLAVDSVLGAIPLLGTVIDIFYRAHSRNLNLLRERDVRQPQASDWLVVGAAVLIFLIALALPILIVIVAISLLR